MTILFQDISRCLLWTQRHHQTWPQIQTDMLTKPVDLLMLNKLKESYCEIRVGFYFLMWLIFCFYIFVFAIPYYP